MGLAKTTLLHSALQIGLKICLRMETRRFLVRGCDGFGLAKDHPFCDGDKRTAFMAMQTFLEINGFELIAPETEAVAIMIILAASEWTKKSSRLG